MNLFNKDGKLNFLIGIFSIVLAIMFIVAGCSKYKYYNRYPDKKPCKMEDNQSKKARKNK